MLLIQVKWTLELDLTIESIESSFYDTQTMALNECLCVEAFSKKLFTGIVLTGKSVIGDKVMGGLG